MPKPKGFNWPLTVSKCFPFRDAKAANMAFCYERLPAVVDQHETHLRIVFVPMIQDIPILESGLSGVSLEVLLFFPTTRGILVVQILVATVDQKARFLLDKALHSGPGDELAIHLNRQALVLKDVAKMFAPTMALFAFFWRCLDQLFGFLCFFFFSDQFEAQLSCRSKSQGHLIDPPVDLAHQPPRRFLGGRHAWQRLFLWDPVICQHPVRSSMSILQDNMVDVLDGF